MPSAEASLPPPANKMSDHTPMDRLTILHVLREVQRLLSEWKIGEAAYEINQLHFALAEDHAFSERRWLKEEHGEHFVRQ